MTKDQVTIRVFEKRDTQRVLSIFTYGMLSLVTEATLLQLRTYSRSVWCKICFMALLPTMLLPEYRLLGASLLFGVPALATLVFWFSARHVLRAYLAKSLSDDLVDITHHYLETPGSCFWVAELNGEVVGTVAVELKPKGPDNKKVAELRRMSVAPSARRRGVAQKLLSTLEQFCRQNKCDELFLTCSSWQPPAVALYSSYGFKQEFRLPMLSLLEKHEVMCYHYFLYVDGIMFRMQLQPAKNA